jgi:hypothetical protein
MLWYSRKTAASDWNLSPVEMGSADVVDLGLSGGGASFVPSKDRDTGAALPKVRPRKKQKGILRRKVWRLPPEPLAQPFREDSKAPEAASQVPTGPRGM